MFLRNLLLGLGALFVVAGIALAVIWMQQIGSPPGQPEPGTAEEGPPPGSMSVLVAAGAIPAGTLLRPPDFGWKAIEAGEVRPGNLLEGQITETALTGSITRRDFADGEALLASELVMPNDRRFLAAVLKPGMRAASISVDASQSASGLVLPGDFVDVILTQNLGDASGPSRKSVGETVLRDLRVVAVGTSLSAQPEAALPEGVVPATAANIPKTVTLELNESQAETLFVATQLGLLQLSVRPLEKVSQSALDDRPASPTWASDVSPALDELSGNGAPITLSTIEGSIRRPPAPPSSASRKTRQSTRSTP
jgi:pilus assembly protein CpaB